MTPKNTSESTGKKELAIELYRRMLLLRIFETRAGELGLSGEMPAFVHQYIGEEAVAVGVCSPLQTGDMVTSTHRGHGHVLAKGGDPKLLMAELYGKATGYSGGRGGSMHVYAPEIGLFGTNGLVAGGIPLAVGAGFTAKYLEKGAVVVCFFGDGASNHGAFHESLNMASNWKLPVIFVCENNLYATATPFASVTANPDIASRAGAYGLPGEAVDGQDIWAVRAAAETAIARARNGLGPTLIESKTYRFVGHSAGEPSIGTYRTAEELSAWKARCPLLLMKDYLMSEAGCGRHELDLLEDQVATEVEEAVIFARESPWPDETALLDKEVWA